MADPEAELVELVAECANDPLKFVLAAYPWGEDGPLKDHAGPDEWQEEFLRGIGEEVKAKGFDGLKAVSPIRRAVSSGHGIGKSVMVAWLVDWIMSTRPHCQGTVTANTFTQLETKTWAAIQRWTKLCITSHWFAVTSNRVYQVDHKESWFVAPQSSKEENSEAFAGQHAADSTSFYIFDEDSAIADSIHEVAEGGLTDGEPMIFCFGNPTRNNGHFYDACFGRMRSRWNPTIVDSRKSRFTNKDQIKEWAEDYGEDSDFFRVRVLGLPPSASDAQFIDQGRVLEAQKRQVIVLPDEPLVAGADLAWGGGDDNVIRFRRGFDARSIAPIRIKGEFTRDPSVLTNRLADVLARDYDGKKVAMLFLDSAGIAGPIAARLRALGFKNVQEVNFGSDSPDSKCRYMRDYMWYLMKEWLLSGAIDKHPELEADLTGPGIRPDNRQRVWLESKETMKKRGVDSPDDGDALCLLGSTLIQTPTGSVRLDSLSVGDTVSTPFGPANVAIVHRSYSDSLTTVQMSNGATLAGKGSHEVFTFDGPIRLDALSLTTEVEGYSQWRNVLWRLASLPYTMAGSIGFKAQAHTFKAGERQTRSAFFIAGCTRMLTGLYRKALKSITSTVTGVTTSSKTLNWYPQVLTSASTCESGSMIHGRWINSTNSWDVLESLPQSGTVHQRASNGIGSTGTIPGKGGNLSLRHVQFAEEPTIGTSNGHATAHRLVHNGSLSARISRMFGSAVSAVRTFLLTVIGLRPIVPVSVQTVAERVETFNLTLDRHNAYYANGILVFNCLTFAAPVRIAKPRENVPPVSRSYEWA